MAFKDPEREKEYNNRRRFERRSMAIAFLGGKCVKCQSTKDLEFDHIDPETKSFDINRLNRKLDIFMIELAKCQLLCEKCHTEKSALEKLKPQIHGTKHSYIYRGCRCPDCTKANSDYCRELYRKNNGLTPDKFRV